MKKSIFNNFAKAAFSAQTESKKFLITGTNGQVGRGLARVLVEKYGKNNVVLTSYSDPIEKFEAEFVKLDINDYQNYNNLVKDKKVSHIIHLAGLLATECEKNLEMGMNVNVFGMQNALNVAKDNKAKIFIPSTFGTFGTNLEKKPLPDDLIQDPPHFYGISKLYMERLGAYYYRKFGTDFRSLRYPAILSPYEHKATRAGTASYPTDLVKSILKNPEKKTHTIGLDDDIIIPFMYISDCIKGTLQLIEADNTKLKRRVYNFQGLSFAPKEFVSELKNHLSFDVKYEIDPQKRATAKGWPVAMDDSNASKDWGWKPEINTTKKLVEVILKDIKQNLNK